MEPQTETTISGKPKRTSKFELRKRAHEKNKELMLLRKTKVIEKKHYKADKKKVQREVDFRSSL